MITPRELPDLKMKIAGDVRYSPSFSNVFEWLEVRYKHKMVITSSMKDEIAEAFGNAVVKSTGHYVTEDFGTLGEFGARSLDTVYLDKSTLPSYPNGAIYSAKKVPVEVVVEREDGKRVSEVAPCNPLYYYEVLGDGTLDIFIFVYYEAGDIWSIAEALNVCLDREQNLENTVVDVKDEEVLKGVSAPFPMKYFFSLILMMNQELVTIEEEYPPRTTIRRMMRQGITSDPAVRVVYLRKPKVRSTNSRHAPYHNQDHRWIVRGHWRKVPCGPKKSMRRLRFIQTFIQGPPDKPLLTGEKVYQWGR